MKISLPQITNRFSMPQICQFLNILNVTRSGHGWYKIFILSGISQQKLGFYLGFNFICILCESSNEAEHAEWHWPRKNLIFNNNSHKKWYTSFSGFIRCLIFIFVYNFLFRLRKYKMHRTDAMKFRMNNLYIFFKRKYFSCSYIFFLCLHGSKALGFDSDLKIIIKIYKTKNTVESFFCKK